MTALTDVIGWTLLHFVWEGVLIAGVTAVFLAALRGASARSRYIVVCGGLALSLAAAVVTPLVLLGLEQASPIVSTPVELPRRILATATTVSQVIDPAVTATTSPDPPTFKVALTTFVSFWIAGVLLLTTRLGLGWWQVRRLHAAAFAAPASEWLAVARRIAERLGLPRPIHVIDSDAVDTPTVIGWLKPVVLLPVAVLASLSPGQVQAILAHELAHVRRHDFMVNLLQTIAETLLFYHPAVWWLSARIRIEREHCCDDIAVEVCGDPFGYAEALTTIASLARVPSGATPSRSLAVAATGGSLLHRVRRLLHLPVENDRRGPKAPFVIAATVLVIVFAGARLLVVAQAPPPLDDPRLARHLGPMDVNRILGFDLFPGPVRYSTDDPADARAWDVRVAYPGGEQAFLGFTGRSLIRYAYWLDQTPVMEGPSWLDTGANSLHAETSADVPTEVDFREAIRVALEGQYRISIRHESRLVPVLGLQPVAPGALGPNLRPASADCIEDIRQRTDLLGPSLHARGQVVVPFCGVDHTIRGPIGYRVTLAQLAGSLRRFGMAPDDEPAREVIDQTGMTGVYDFELNLGFLPLAAIATEHPAVGIGFGPMIRTFPQALEEQLGLKLVPSDTPRDVVVIATAQEAHRRAFDAERQLASRIAD
jgi:uncharacterized protein (TIGR03435 family)